MTRGRLVRIAAVLAVVAVGAVWLLGGGEDYRLQMRMANASGLKDGSSVVMGGIPVGKVDLHLDGDVVRVDLEIEDDHAPLPRDVKASVISQNLLGQKQVQLEPGTSEADAPSGFTIPASHVRRTADLDQVLDVLDADTRTRLAIFVNEAGAALTGRRADFNRLLTDLTPALSDGQDLLSELRGQNGILGDLVIRSDRLVAAAAGKREDLTRMVDRVGRAATTVATRRGDLRATLAEAPGTLTRFRAFLTRLGDATAPLATAARTLRATAGPLTSTLDQLEPFRKVATPTLDTAGDLAPLLSRLAAKATPVLRAAAPTVEDVRRLAADDLPPITDITDRSIYNIVAVLENWARAIQFRDGLGHIFRGEATVAPDLVNSAVDRLLKHDKKARRRHRATRSDHAADAPATHRRDRSAGRQSQNPPELPGGAGEAPDDTTKGFGDTPDNGSSSLSSGIKGLLDYLLGG